MEEDSIKMKLPQLIHWIMDNIKPDITLYVKVESNTARNRIKKRNATLTSFEKEKQDFIQKLITGFDDVIQR